MAEKITTDAVKTAGGTTASFSNTPQASGDTFNLTEDGISANIAGRTIITLDVMANDAGGAAKSLYSLDDGKSDPVTTPSKAQPAAPLDLAKMDVAANGISSWEPAGYLADGVTSNGILMRINNGKVEMDLTGYLANYLAQNNWTSLDQMGPNDSINESFTYAIKLGNGTLSWATATVNIQGTNDAPVITTGATATFAENTTATTVVYDAAATDAEGNTVTFSLGGADKDLFSINASTGEVTFIASPNYESPQDADGNNVYNITVIASDGNLQTSKDVAITVNNVNEAPELTSGATGSIDENAAVSTVVYDAAATDPENDALIYSLSGDDAALFDIDENTGEVAFLASPDHENPQDLDGDNVYDIVVTASDGTLSDSKNVAITVNNVNEAPELTSGATGSIDENAAVSTVVYDAAATDPENDALIYSLSGDDAALFDIDENTGEVTFLASPDHENPQDLDGDNVYDIVVTASDGTLSDSKNVAITVNNVNEAPELTSGATGSIDENAAVSTVVYDAAATDPENDALIYSLSGDDAALFDIDENTGEVTFLASPDHENPQDLDGDNVYDIVVTASDGTLSDSKNVAITINNVNEAPELTSGATGSIDENAAVSTVVYDAAATDPENDALIYSLSGDDAALFDIDENTGEVTFLASPDHENPQDLDGDNVYDIVITASDGTLSDSKNVAITVNNVNEAPQLSLSNVVSSTDENGGPVKVADITIIDDGIGTNQLSLSGTDSGAFTISGNALYFNGGADFETKSIYNVTVQVNDSTVGATPDDSESVMLTINNVPEGPVIAGPYNTLVPDPNDFDSAGPNTPTELNGGSGADTLVGTNSGEHISGGSGTDTLYGKGGADSINGGAQADNIYGQAGDDNTLQGDSSGDTIYGGSGNDVIEGGSGDDVIYGGSGIDTINGGSGGDTVMGGFGADIIDVAEDNDTIKFRAIEDTGDRIYNWATGDKLDFSLIDATFGGADNAFTLTAGSTVVANGINYFFDGSDTKVWADTDGDIATVELEVTLVGVNATLTGGSNIIL